MAELADAPGLGPGGAIREGSTPSLPRAKRRHRLAWPRTSGSQPEDSGSNPDGADLLPFLGTQIASFFDADLRRFTLIVCQRITRIFTDILKLLSY